jgi:hypothetical protein
MSPFNLSQCCSHGRPDLNRAGVKEFSARYRLPVIVIAVPAKERNIMRII